MNVRLFFNDSSKNHFLMILRSWTFCTDFTRMMFSNDFTRFTIFNWFNENAIFQWYCHIAIFWSFYRNFYFSMILPITAFLNDFTPRPGVPAAAFRRKRSLKAAVFRPRRGLKAAPRASNDLTKMLCFQLLWMLGYFSMILPKNIF